MQASDELEAELGDLDDIEEALPQDDEALEQAEQQADEQLDDLFGDDSEPADAAAASEQPQQTKEANADHNDDDDDNGYLDIDSLMQDADDDEADDNNDDKYDAAKVEELLNDEELQDVNADEPDVDEEASAQLDLARAYIDMGEEDEAREILQQLTDNDDERLAKDAKALLLRIDS